jgi:hypothetical protein
MIVHGQRNKRLATQPRSRARSESAAVLALFALFLNLLAAFVPPPALAAFNGSDSALLCTSAGDTGNGETPATPPHRHCQDCLAQQIGGNANLPEPGPALLTLPRAEPLSSAHNYLASPSQPATPSQPRAPPTAG